MPGLEREQPISRNFSIRDKPSYETIHELSHAAPKVNYASAPLRNLVAQAIIENIEDLMQGEDIPITDILSHFTYVVPRVRPYQMVSGQRAVAEIVSPDIARQADTLQVALHHPRIVFQSGNVLFKTTQKVIEQSEERKRQFLEKERKPGTGKNLEDVLSEEDATIAEYNGYATKISSVLDAYRNQYPLGR